MDPTLFSGAKLKIERANQHIQELQSCIGTFLQTDFYRLYIENDPKAQQKMLKFEMTTPMPKNIPLILGDSLHNLRSVLDHMAFEIVDRAGGSTKHIKFPMRKTRQELKAALTGGEMKVAGSDIIDLIVDVVQPYPGGNGAALCVLHELDISDKHFAPIPVVEVASVTFTGTLGGNTFSNIHMTTTRRNPNLIAFPINQTINGQMHPTFTVRFADRDVFKGQSVVPTLKQLAQLVTGILQTVEQVYLAKVALAK